MYKGPFDRVQTGAVDRGLWNQALAANPSADIFQTPEWVDAICAAGGYEDSSRVVEAPDGGSLVVPMVRRTGAPGLLRIAESLPAAWGTGGVLSTAAPLRPEDVEAVWRHLVSEPFARVRVRPEHTALHAWDRARLPSSVVVQQQHKSVIDLTGGFEQVWKGFKSSARNKVRKAERSGISVESDATGLFVDPYYDLYLKWVSRRARERRLPERLMRLRASRIEPIQKFRSVSEKLDARCRIWVARRNGDPVAAAIMLIHSRHATYWRSFSSKEDAGSANNLLQKHMIEYACTQGCTDYNMGWSGTTSLVEYKRSFGARLLTFPVYTWDRVPLTGPEKLAATLREKVKRRNE